MGEFLPPEIREIPSSLLAILRGCPEVQELEQLPHDESYSTSSEFRDVHILKKKERNHSSSGALPVERAQEIRIPWKQVSTSLKESLAAFIGCDIRSLTSISFMVFLRESGIGSHCDQPWVGDSFWGFSFALESAVSSAESYKLLFRTKGKTGRVVFELDVERNTAYHCSGDNRYYFEHEVPRSSTVGRRFFMRVGLNRFLEP